MLGQKPDKQIQPSKMKNRENRHSISILPKNAEQESPKNKFFKRVFRKAFTLIQRKSHSQSSTIKKNLPTKPLGDPPPEPLISPKLFKYLPPKRLPFRQPSKIQSSQAQKLPKPPLIPPRVIVTKGWESSEKSRQLPLSRSTEALTTTDLSSQSNDFVPPGILLHLASPVQKERKREKSPVIEILPFSQIPKNPPHPPPFLNDESPLSRVFTLCELTKKRQSPMQKKTNSMISRSVELENFVENQFQKRQGELKEMMEEEEEISNQGYLNISTKPSLLSSFIGRNSPSSPMSVIEPKKPKDRNTKSIRQPRRHTYSLKSVVVRSQSEDKKQTRKTPEAELAKMRPKMVEKSKRMFQVKKRLVHQNLQLKAQGTKFLSQERTNQESIQKAVRSGRKLLHNDRKVVMTHLTAIINAPPLHVRQSSQDSIASSSLSYSLNSPKEEVMLNKATITDKVPRVIKITSPPQFKPKAEESLSENSPEMLKLPSKSAGARNAAFFFRKNKRVTSKKRKIIQISAKVGNEREKGSEERKRETSLKGRLKPTVKKKSSTKVVKKVKKKECRTPELETEPTAVGDELSYNFDSDLMRLNSEIDLNSHKAELEGKSEKTLSIAMSPLPCQEYEEIKQEPISQSTFAKMRDKKQQEAENASNPQSAKRMEFPRRFQQLRLLTADYEHQNLDLLSLIPEQKCYSGNTSGRSRAQSYQKKSPQREGSQGSKAQKLSSSDSNSSKLTAGKLITKRLGKNKTRNSLSSFPSQVTQKGLIQTPEGSDNGLYSDSSSKKRKPGKRISCESLINSRTGTYTEDSQLFAYSSGSEADNETRPTGLIPRQEQKKEIQVKIKKASEGAIPPTKKELFPPRKKQIKQKSWNLLELKKEEKQELMQPLKEPENLSSRMLKAFKEFRAKEPSLKSCPTVNRNEGVS